MRNFFWIVLFALFFSSTSFATQSVYILNIKGAIGPAMEDYIKQGISTANQNRAAAILIQLNTSGGLEKSTRKITRAILNSSIPVISYVTPNGAHAAGTSLLILYASHIAAMTPDTQLESFTTTNSFKNKLIISLDQTNSIDKTVSTIREFAKLRHRNADWAEQAMRGHVTLTSNEALKQNVINLIANDIPDLLQKLNNTSIDVNRIPIMLDTKAMNIQTLQPNWRYSIFSIITNPIIIYLLFLIGILGVLLTFLNPFKMLLGFISSICLIIAFYVFQLLPTNFIGLTLVLVGLTCIMREIVIANFGLTATLGVISFVAGSILMLDMHSAGYYLPLSLVVLVSLSSAGLVYLILVFTVKGIRKPSKHSTMIGKTGEVLEIHADYVIIQIQNEIWNAQSKNHLEIGQKVRVSQASNSILIVEPFIAVFEK